MPQYTAPPTPALRAFRSALVAAMLLAVSPLVLAASDNDGDGIANRKDQCPSSNPQARVDSRGCEFDGDGDGVVNHHDQCADSTTGVAVNIDGCAHDSDEDSVVDFRDSCPNTNAGVSVDATGCPLGDILSLLDFSCQRFINPESSRSLCAGPRGEYA